MNCDPQPLYDRIAPNTKSLAHAFLDHLKTPRKLALLHLGVYSHLSKRFGRKKKLEVPQELLHNGQESKGG